jgi:hypothetical protein
MRQGSISRQKENLRLLRLRALEAVEKLQLAAKGRILKTSFR